MTDRYILDADHNPVPIDDLMEWSEKFNPDDKVVEQEDVQSPSGETFWVSTVFLGLDHQFDNGPPILFETMVFGYKDDGTVDFCERDAERYCTWDEAQAGHKRFVEAVRTGASGAVAHPNRNAE